MSASNVVPALVAVHMMQGALTSATTGELSPSTLRLMQVSLNLLEEEVRDKIEAAAVPPTAAPRQMALPRSNGGGPAGPADPAKIYSVGEAQKILGMGATSFHKRVNEGTISPTRKKPTGYSGAYLNKLVAAGVSVRPRKRRK